MRKHLSIVLMIFLLLVASHHNVWAQEKQLILRVDGLACPFCAFGLEKKISKMKGFVSYDANLEVGEVYVALKNEPNIDTSFISKAVKESGFTLIKIILKDGDKEKELEFTRK